MQTTTWRLAIATAALLLAGCAAQPKSGQDSTAYYYSSGSRAASTVAPVAITRAPQDLSGPANVARMVYFDFDSSTVRAADQGIVEAHGSYLRSHPQSRVLLTGHTDQRGGAEYNLALGQRRALSVERALTQLGVSADRIEAVSYGKERPASTVLSEAGYQLNRRVEFVYR